MCLAAEASQKFHRFFFVLSLLKEGGERERFWHEVLHLYSVSENTSENLYKFAAEKWKI